MPTENWDEVEIVDTENESEPTGDVKLEKDEKLSLIDIEYESTSAETQKKRKRFLQSLNGRFMAMAMAGFVILGGAWEKSYADQLRITKKDRGAPEFVLEEGITKEKLEKFKKELADKEPGFLAWLERYKRKTSLELDKLTKATAEIDEGAHFEQEDKIRNYYNNLNPDYIAAFIERDHEVLSFLKDNPDFVSKIHGFFKDHVEDIILAVALMDNSRETRNMMVRIVNPVSIRFKYHDADSLLNGQLAYTMPMSEKIRSNADLKPNQWWPEIVLNPLSFIGHDDVVEVSSYFDTLEHEFVHALHPGSKNTKNIRQKSGFASVVGEGWAQYTTFEIAQYLGNENPEIGLRPYAGYGSDYDQRLILGAILDSVAKSTGKDSFLSRWHMGIISDRKVASDFKKALGRLGIKSQAWKSLLEQPILRGLSVEEWIYNFLAQLKLEGLQISPELLGNILIHGRKLESWQIKSIKDDSVNPLVQGMENKLKIKK